MARPVAAHRHRGRAQCAVARRRAAKGRRSMELSLAIAMTCESTGCQVRDLDGGETSTVRYAAPVQDRIMIRPGDLVVVNSAAQPGELVWRWWSGRVEGIEGDTVVVSRRVTRSNASDLERGEERLPLPVWLADSVAVGDMIFHTHTPAGIIDVARNGVPVHPEHIRSEGFAEIIATYARIADAS